MADAAEDDVEELDDDAEASASGGGKKKLIMIGAAALVLLLGGGGAYFFLMGGDDAAPATDQTAAAMPAAEDAVAQADAVYYEMPTVQVNLASSSSRSTYLRVVATLEVANTDDAATAKEKKAEIADSFQALLRELRPDDIAGSGGLMRVKEELLVRANAAIGKNAVKNVLLTEFLVQ